MSGIKDSENIDSLRNRLYQRGTSGVGDIHHELTDDPTPLPTEWNVVPGAAEFRQGVPLPDVVPETYEPAFAAVFPDMKKNKKRGYRLKLALLGVAFFGVAMVVSSFFMVFGRNSISGDNITLALTIPFTIGGGELLPIQVGINNQNTVPMESATLIVEYPPGTKSDEENPRDLFTERIPLDTIDAGQTLNMPLRARVFGEENSEKSIKVSIEYRVQGSSARFYKESDPQKFKISSAPISFRVDGLRRVSNGQETSLTLTVVSNSLTPVSEVLVKAEYPVGFEFKRANPEPESGKNSWIIKDVQPQSTHTITITGVVKGQDTSEYVMKFSAGIPNERDKSNFASIFANAETSFEIEKAFIDIGVRVGGVADRIVAVDPGQSVSANIKINNTLEDPVYDLRIIATMSGNAFGPNSFSATNGFYNTLTKTQEWDISDDGSLSQLQAGSSKDFSMNIRPSPGGLVEPFVDIKVDVYARRVSESNVAEELLGSVERTIRVNSEANLVAATTHGVQTFSDSGPIPPKVGSPTTYTLAYRIENGNNNINNAKVTATLPLYVTWLDNTTGDGRFEYNQTNRMLTWTPGTVTANGVASASFQVEFLPSGSQIGKTPILLGEQLMDATDAFTSKSLKARHEELTISLPREAGFNPASGVVVAE